MSAETLAHPHQRNNAKGAVDPLIPFKQVTELAGIGRTMIYRLIRRGDFPQPYKPGGTASRWSRAEVIAWRNNQRTSKRD